MAPAISTSKRKFYRLLEGLSASPSRSSFPQTDAAPQLRSQSTQSLIELPSSEVVPSTPDPPTKRARIITSHRPSTSSGPSRSGTPSTNRMLKGTPSVRLVTQAGDRRSYLGLSSGLSGQDDRPLPNFAPWSDEQFLGRLKTFADIKIWPPKPDRLDEVQWAKRGWVCEGVNTVACKGCGERVVIQLQKQSKAGKDEEWEADFDEALLQKYAELIVAGHDEQCLWRSSGCKDDIFRIRMGDVPARNAGIKARYESLVTIMDSLPDSLVAPETFHRIHPVPNPKEPFDLQNFLNYASTVITPSSTPLSPQDTPRTPDLSLKPRLQPINKTAFALALFGWSGSTSYGIPMSTCSHCFVRNGMWLYSRKTALLSSPRSQRLQEQANSPTNGTDPKSPISPVEDNPFNFELDLLHREYCPWRNPDSQKGVGQFLGLAGWEILVNTVLDQAAARAHTQEALKSAESTAVSSPVPRSPSSTISTTFSATESKERRRQADQQDQARMSRFKKLRDALGIRRSKPKETPPPPASPSPAGAAPVTTNVAATSSIPNSPTVK